MRKTSASCYELCIQCHKRLASPSIKSILAIYFRNYRTNSPLTQKWLHLVTELSILNYHDEKHGLHSSKKMVVAPYKRPGGGLQLIAASFCESCKTRCSQPGGVGFLV